MSYSGVLDPDSAAAVANTALEQGLVTLQQVTVQAKAAAASASAAAATQAAVSALLDGIGIPHLWSGTKLQIRLPDGTYGVAVDLEGPQGPAGPTPVIRIGTVGEGDFAVEANLVNPAYPILNFTLERGAAAWTPLFSIIADGARRVLQINDWTGGGGSKPPIGAYVGGAGLTTVLANAIDLRGAAGNLSSIGTIASGDIAVFGTDSSQVISGGSFTTIGKALASAITAASALAAIGAQAALGFTPQDSASRGIANGYASLDGSGKVPTALLPASVLGDVQYQGAWNAATNVPAIPASSSANKGWYYVVQVAGSTAISGQSDWQVGDWIVSDGTAWDKIDNTDLVTSVAGLVGPITATGLKAALAIAASDISNATVTGRAVLTAASVAALTAMLSIMSGDTGTGGTAGLVPTPSAGDGAAGKFLRADGSWSIPLVGPVGARAVSAGGAVQLSDLGKVLRLSGTYILAGPTATSGFYFWVSKRDGNGVVTFTPPSGTIDGLASIQIYQESFLIWCDGTNWWSQNRPKGWISIGTTVIASAVASVMFSTGFTDPELIDMEFVADNVAFSTADFLSTRIQRGGGILPSGYTGAGAVQTGTGFTNVNQSSAPSAAYVSYTSTTLPIYGRVTVFGIQTVNARTEANSGVAGAASYTLMTTFNSTTGATQALQFLGYGGNSLVSGIISQKAWRQ